MTPRLHNYFNFFYKSSWGDVYDFRIDEFRSHVYIIEIKTGKKKKFLLNKNALKSLIMLKDSLESIEDFEYIFKSREGDNKPITRFMAIKTIKSSCDAVGIKERVGCHSLRKTFGYHSWKKGFHYLFLWNFIITPINLSPNFTLEYLRMILMMSIGW